MQIPCDFVLPLWQVSLFVSCPLRSGLPSKDKSWRWIKTKSGCKHTENILNSQKKTTLLFKSELGIMENPFTKPRPGFTVLYINKGLCFNKAYDETLAEESQKYGQVN